MRFVISPWLYTRRVQAAQKAELRSFCGFYIYSREISSRDQRFIYFYSPFFFVGWGFRAGASRCKFGRALVNIAGAKNMFQIVFENSPIAVDWIDV